MSNVVYNEFVIFVCIYETGHRWIIFLMFFIIFRFCFSFLADRRWSPLLFSCSWQCCGLSESQALCQVGHPCFLSEFTRIILTHCALTINVSINTRKQKANTNDKHKDLICNLIIIFKLIKKFIVSQPFTKVHNHHSLNNFKIFHGYKHNSKTPK